MEKTRQLLTRRKKKQGEGKRKAHYRFRAATIDEANISPAERDVDPEGESPLIKVGKDERPPLEALREGVV